MQRYVPERGDAIWITFDPHTGHEQAGRRPAVVLSPSAYNGRIGLAVVCPITTQAKGYPFEVALPPSLKVKGVVLADHVRSLDWRSRNAVRISKVPEEMVAEVLDTLASLLSPEA